MLLSWRCLGMGMAAISGCDNDDLVDRLVEANFVVSHRVETVLRIVDRGRFFPKEGRMYAYRNLPWRSKTASPGCIHISSPRVYAKALKYLNLMKGNKFLNIGSGTGYLNTLAGYFLGSTGANHGIEIHQNIVQYARELVEETLKRPETQCFDWAVPEFACVDGFFLSPEHYGKYDRVYCNAPVPADDHCVLWKLIRIGGILLTRHFNEFMLVRRKTESIFETSTLASKFFTNPPLPVEEEISNAACANVRTCEVSFTLVPTLQYICATFIRQRVRAALFATHTIYIRNYVNQQPWRVRDYIDLCYDNESIPVKQHGTDSVAEGRHEIEGSGEVEPEVTDTGYTSSDDSSELSSSGSTDSSGTSQVAAGTSWDCSPIAGPSRKRSHFELEGGSSSAKERNNGGTLNSNNELQTDVETWRERARLQECEWQRKNIEQFALLFERRVMELPLNEALKNYIKYLSK